MKIEIDQSGKIENTNRLSVVAYANGFCKTLLITARDKKSILTVFRKIKQPRIFISKVFAAAIFLLIKDNFKVIDDLVIDNEYPGHENVIKLYLKEYLNKNGFQSDKINISFRSIGKKSKAHDAAWKAYRMKKADIRASAENIMQIIFK